ncbi:MAG: DUF3037 domain-containing protein [Tepidisphaeraceae bacterium]|jgi:hypothetical protein
MALGAYSVVRYSDTFRDERVNLGVVVWHPSEGFQCRFAGSLDRVHAINPLAEVFELRKQIKVMKGRLRDEGAQGRTLMDELSQWFHEGLEFSKPYPTRLTAASETVARLFDLLVPPATPPREAEATFQTKVVDILHEQVIQIDRNCLFEDLEERWINNVKVKPGVHTKVHNIDMLWRTVSMRVRAIEDRIARAKATAIDITRIRGLTEFSNYRCMVAVESPAKYAGDAFTESQRWLESVGASVLPVPDLAELPQLIGERLRA